MRKLKQVPYTKKDRNGKEYTQYSLKDKVAYHRSLADARMTVDHKTGEYREATMSECVNHALAANRAQRKLNRYMQTVKYLDKQGAIKQGFKPKTK